MPAHRVIRPHRIVGDDCLILLQDGSEVVVDAADADLVIGYSWRWQPNRKTGSVRRSYRVDGRCYSIHIADVIRPPEEGFVNDHRDGDPRNNRRANLRPATRLQNNRNCSKRSAISGFKGVYPNRHKWVAKITVNGVTRSIGNFYAAEDAARAYDEAARHHFGEFACLNFPQENERET